MLHLLEEARALEREVGDASIKVDMSAEEEDDEEMDCEAILGGTDHHDRLMDQSGMGRRYCRASTAIVRATLAKESAKTAGAGIAHLIGVGQAISLLTCVGKLGLAGYEACTGDGDDALVSLAGSGDSLRQTFDPTCWVAAVSETGAGAAGANEFSCVAAFFGMYTAFQQGLPVGQVNAQTAEQEEHMAAFSWIPPSYSILPGYDEVDTARDVMNAMILDSGCPTDGLVAIRDEHITDGEALWARLNTIMRDTVMYSGCMGCQAAANTYANTAATVTACAITPGAINVAEAMMVAAGLTVDARMEIALEYFSPPAADIAKCGSIANYNQAGSDHWFALVQGRQSIDSVKAMSLRTPSQYDPLIRCYDGELIPAHVIAAQEAEARTGIVTSIADGTAQAAMEMLRTAVAKCGNEDCKEAIRAKKITDMAIAQLKAARLESEAAFEAARVAEGDWRARARR